jgi:hypothetical protein
MSSSSAMKNISSEECNGAGQRGVSMLKAVRYVCQHVRLRERQRGRDREREPVRTHAVLVHETQPGAASATIVSAKRSGVFCRADT